MKNDLHQPLIPNGIYHVFSRAVGSEKLFITESNYLYFLQKLKQHIEGVAKVYCYSLLPNHFHILIKVNDEETISKKYEEVKKKPYSQLQTNLSEFIMERFGNLLNAYTKAFNKMNDRKGNLFMDTMKRNKAENDDMITAFIFYIHKNAVHHGLTSEIGEWKFDSFNSFLSNHKTELLRDEVISWFGKKKDFIHFHKQSIVLKFQIDEL